MTTDVRIWHWVEGEGDEAAIHWRTSTGATGHGEPIGLAEALEWVRHLNSRDAWDIPRLDPNGSVFFGPAPISPGITAVMRDPEWPASPYRVEEAE